MNLKDIYGNYQLSEKKPGCRTYENTHLGYTALVATDDLFLKDWMLSCQVPDKGIWQTRISTFWAIQLDRLARTENFPLTAFLTSDERSCSGVVEHYPDALKAPELRHRTIISHKIVSIPIRFHVYGYLVGKLWTEYEIGTQEFYGVCLPNEMKYGDRLATPVVMTTVKQGNSPSLYSDSIYDLTSYLLEKGWDEYFVGVDTIVDLQDAIVGLQRIVRRFYQAAAEYTAKYGVVLADAKFDYGYTSQNIPHFGGHLLAPDSATYWLESSYQPGKLQPSFEKQLLYDYLKETWMAGDEVEEIPKEVINETAGRYKKLCQLLTSPIYLMNY